ncbi:hypothetical protein ABWH96_16490 [Marivirga tractuosa]|uniref:hypothetical protein n=1 Tax=Marivirga tractuosa TaxID=1006 RepID=UPI0035D0BC1C
MKLYFQIQWSIINRHMKEAGLNIILAWILVSISFGGLSMLFFNKYEYAGYIYFAIPLFLSIRIADFKRNEFLRICYGDQKFHLIRLLENLMISVPFLIVLLISKAFLVSGLLLIFSSLLALLPWDSKFRFILPTPFKKRPFEFIVGFRKTFLVIVLNYAIAIIAVKVDNFNLGLFTLIVSFLISFSYYSFMEDEFYVWTHKDNPNRFLWDKIKVASVFNAILYLPLIILLSLFFPYNIYQILILYGVGVFFMMAVVFIKYSAFPEKVGLKESIVFSVTFYFPPLILITFPYFYFQSIKSLSKVLK